jgi:hypothetical protein
MAVLDTEAVRRARLHEHHYGCWLSRHSPPAASGKPVPGAAGRAPYAPGPSHLAHQRSEATRPEHSRPGQQRKLGA